MREIVFPERPALKFIPSPEVSHQLLLEAAIEFDKIFFETTIAKLEADPTIIRGRTIVEQKANPDQEDQNK